MKGRILIVDDDEELLDILSVILKDAGFQVMTAQDAEEFHRLAFLEKPNLIILDIMLGDKDGTVIYQQLLMEGLDKNIPVLFLTALAHGSSVTPAQPGRTYAL